MKPIPQTNAAYILIAVSLEFTSMRKALEGTSLTAESLSYANMIDLTEAIKVANNINKYSYTPNWPTIFGNHLGIVTHGPVGYASVSAPTIGKALSTFIEWFPIRSNCYSSQVSEQDDTFEISIFDTSGDTLYKAFFFESLMRAFEVLMGLLLGHLKKQQTNLYFEVEVPSRREFMVKEYASKLHFGADSNKLVIPKSIWYQPSPLVDNDSHILNLRKCQQISDDIQQMNRIDIAVRNIIRNSLENSVISNQVGQRLPSLKQISLELHQSERTIVRKLNRLGTSYQNILETQRKIYADKLLSDARYTVTDIADMLGYSESASFCRAFKQWYGQSPSVYRRNPKTSPIINRDFMT